MEAWQENNTWKVNKLDTDYRQRWKSPRRLQFYYKTKSMLLKKYSDRRKNSRMPFGIGNDLLGVSTWNVVPYAPSRHGYQNEYIEKIVNPFF